jgi:hypothetical protein
MKKWIVGVAGLLVTGFAAAAVVPVDANHDGSFAAFLDAPHALMWTNANAFAPATFAVASAEVSASRIEGYSDWRLPTLGEFLALYQTQGSTGGGMTMAPFTSNANWYTTTDVYAAQLAQNHAFGPTHTPADQSMVFFRTTVVGVWAVRAVPEPTSLAMMLAGVAGLGAWRIRRSHVA